VNLFTRPLSCLANAGHRPRWSHGLELSRDDFYKKELTFQVSCSYGPADTDAAYEEGGQDYPFGYVRWTAQRNFEAVPGT